MDRRESLEFVQVCVASGLSEAFSEGISGNFQLCDLKLILYSPPLINLPLFFFVLMASRGT